MNFTNKNYNERLFSGKGIRNYLHSARFKWAIDILNKIDHTPRRIIEVGCFDGKFIDYLTITPERYVGLDANWEGGIDLAIKKYANNSNFLFIKGESPDELDIINSEQFDLGVTMETLEHVPPNYVPMYLEKLSKHINGYLLITIPNEKGVVFLTKWLAKKIVYGDEMHYSYTEIISASLGRMDKISRNEHKGFDYSELINDVQKYFDIVRVEAIPFNKIPLFLAFNVGILAKSR